MTIQSPFKAEVQAAIEGGEWAEAKFVDGSSEKVFLRLPLRNFQAYIDGGDDMAVAIALSCGKPVEWTDRLEDASSFQLFGICRRLADPRVASWVKAMNQEAENLRALKAKASTPPASPPGS